jgi:hypothetical protein
VRIRSLVRPGLQVPLSILSARLSSPVRPILQVALLAVPGGALDHAGDLSGLQVTILIA